MKDYLSVVFAAYNRASYLEAMLGQLLEQRKEFPETEVIVIDDGSEEDMTWLDDIPDIKVVHRWNGGAAAARNTGMKLATGKWLVVLDSDDTLLPNYLSTIYADMRQGYDWVSYRWTCDGSIEGARRTDEPLMVNCAAWAYAFKREITKDIWFDETMVLAEDQDWLHRVLKPTHKYKHSQEIIYDYRWIDNPNSVVHRYLNNLIGAKRKGKDMNTYKNVFFIHNINSIGGIETMFYNMAVKYGKTHDITIFYQTGDIAQLDRLRRLVRVKKYEEGKHFKCEKLFCNLATDIIKDAEADVIYQIIHTDYKIQKIPFTKNPRVTHYIAVSECVAKSFEEWTGIKCQVAYNPVVVTKPQKILHLISATRLTGEKGANRMKILADALDEAKIPFSWTVYTDNIYALQHPSIMCKEQKLNILNDIADADYLVQLSDCEGYPYSVLEALTLSTPVIVTAFGVAEEIGIVNGTNGFILPMDMSKIPVKQIYKGLKPFKYTPKQDGYKDLLAEGESTYGDELKQQKEVVCIKDYYDLEMEKDIHYGDKFIVLGARAEHLVNFGVCKYVE